MGKNKVKVNLNISNTDIVEKNMASAIAQLIVSKINKAPNCNKEYMYNKIIEELSKAD